MICLKKQPARKDFCEFIVYAVEIFLMMIETKHPGGKRGIILPEKVYEDLAAFVIQSIRRDENCNLLTLLHAAENEFPDLNELNILVYHVKLDLEARGLIKSVRSREEENIRLRLTSQGIRKNRENVFF